MKLLDKPTTFTFSDCSTPWIVSFHTDSTAQEGIQTTPQRGKFNIFPIVLPQLGTYNTIYEFNSQGFV